MGRNQRTGRETDFRKEYESPPLTFPLGFREPRTTPAYVPKGQSLQEYLGMIFPSFPLSLGPVPPMQPNLQGEAGPQKQILGKETHGHRCLKPFLPSMKECPRNACQAVEGLGLFCLYIRN